MIADRTAHDDALLASDAQVTLFTEPDPDIPPPEPDPAPHTRQPHAPDRPPPPFGLTRSLAEMKNRSWGAKRIPTPPRRPNPNRPHTENLLGTANLAETEAALADLVKHVKGWAARAVDGEDTG